MSIARHHAEWLSLVPVSGPFLSLPVLMDALNTGLEPHDPDQSRLLRQEYGTWQESFEKRKADPAPHQQWINFILTKTLDLDDRVLAEGQKIPQTLQAEVAEHHEFLRPNIVVIDPNTQKPRLLVQTYPRSQELTSYVVNSRWKASPDTRMTELLHATGVRLGLVTNGEHWMLVDAPKGETSGYASWYVETWLDEKLTLQAFRTLLSASRFFGDPEKTLEALLKKSASNQQEVTEQLGYQVRRAVEVLIHSLDRADQDFGRALLAEVTPEQLYESALTVMMRLVFLFCAEERELIPSKPFPVYEQNYSVSTISKQLRELADQHGEELLERRYDAWPRLLAAFRAVYGGLQHDDVHIPAYGGSLFNPDRFPFLEGRKRGTSWRDGEANPLPVNNRTVLHLLEALQYLEVKAPGISTKTTRRISFKHLDIEQIGHVYEGLLDHTAKRAGEPFLGLAGSRDKEPEIPLAELEKLRAKGEADLAKFLKEEAGKLENAVKKALKVDLDPQDAARFRTACQSDDALWKRVKPFAGLVRLDNFGYPVVIPQGSVFVTAGTDRRSSGTHYTPKSLTEPIVQHTLEPLVYVGPAEGKPKGEWMLKSAKELLALKICDMACGSGAFLVQACRYLAVRLLEAWDAAKQANPSTPGITPEGEPSTGKSNEGLIPDDPAERKTYAMRIIAQRCLYGVDKNPLAAEMAKLSLWLLTVAKDKPFEFLDHAIRCGDSLVGLHDIKQLKDYSLKEDNKITFQWPGEFEEPVDAALNLRLKLEDMPANTVEDVERQEKLLQEANDKIARLRCAADLLVAAEFWGENAKDKLERVRHAAVKTGHYVEKGPTGEFEQAAAKERRGQSMFHWPLEFPEVIVKRGGFDAFVGNPPFMGGQKISGSFSDNYRRMVVDAVGDGAKGSGDICAYFFLRANRLNRPAGVTCLIATNTIAQGDTRQIGLDQLTARGATIYRAVSSQPWPGQAAVFVAICHLFNGLWMGNCVLDGQSCDFISGYLDAVDRTANPYRLNANENLSFKGSELYGLGFLVTKEQAAELISSNPGNRRVLSPYLDGQAVNSAPDCSAERWTINFTGMDMGEASRYAECFAIVEEKVKPQRLALEGRNASGSGRAKQWWRFSREVKELYDAIATNKKILVIARVSRTVAFVFVTPNQILNEKLIVFVPKEWRYFAILQTSIHIEWCWTYASTLKGDLNYSQTDCFETYPFPTSIISLEHIGEAYHEHRRQIMLERQEGLTKTYNRFHDPDESSADIQQLRKLHVEMDRAVVAAYGWTDIDLGHGFHETKQGVRFTISELARREVLQRLLKLNHERYAEEEKQGLHDAKRKPARVAPKPKPTKASPSPTLFGDDDATFPSTERDNYLCGLVCELVKAESGLHIYAYVDSLVIALGFDRHKRLLTGNDRTQFATLCKASPLASWISTDKIPWAELQNLLTQRKAVELDDQTMQAGSELAEVRKTYPAVAPELVVLLRKAAAELRELQGAVSPESGEAPKDITPEKAEILQAFSHDRDQWFGVAA